MQDGTERSTETISEVDAPTLSSELDHGSTVLVDVREPYERMTARIDTSLHIPLAVLSRRIASEVSDRGTDLVLYCAQGLRSRDGCRLLQQLGYKRVRSLAGGLLAWEEAGCPVTRPLDQEGREWSARYARQVRIPEVGPEGQKKLLAARVLIIGAGGLGSPAAYYLAAAGVGTLGLVDHDRVDESNLHRQILYTAADVGTPKVHIAQSRLRALNPDVTIVAHDTRFTAENAERLAGDFDLVIDGADNFATRYLVNDICLKLGRPNVHGSIHRFEGQVSVFCDPDGPCYRCVYPEPPPAGWVPSCAEAGVLGVLPGVVGTLQATEAIKVLLGLGRPLVGQLLRFDALCCEFDRFDVPKRADCGWCAPGTEFPGLADYDRFCASDG